MQRLVYQYNGVCGCGWQWGCGGEGKGGMGWGLTRSMWPAKIWQSKQVCLYSLGVGVQPTAKLPGPKGEGQGQGQGLGSWSGSRPALGSQSRREEEHKAVHEQG